jgi:hypothetical protein
MTSDADTAVKCYFASFLGFLPLKANLVQTRQILPLLANNRNLPPPVSVDLGMWKVKRFARLTIRIPRELKDKIQEIDRLYGVALPKVANECLNAFCAYVQQRNRHQLSPSELAPAIAQLTAFQFASAKEFETVHWQTR